MLPLPPFETATELLWFLVGITVVGHSLIMSYVYLSPTLSERDLDRTESEWKYDPATFDDD